MSQKRVDNCNERSDSRSPKNSKPEDIEGETPRAHPLTQVRVTSRSWHVSHRSTEKKQNANESNDQDPSNILVKRHTINAHKNATQDNKIGHSDSPSSLLPTRLVGKSESSNKYILGCSDSNSHSLRLKQSYPRVAIDSTKSSDQASNNKSDEGNLMDRAFPHLLDNYNPPIEIERKE